MNQMFNNIFNNVQVVNGVKINVPKGATISIKNGEVYINGTKYEGEGLKGKEAVNIIVEGEVNSVDCLGSVTVNGQVCGSIDCGGSVTISGDMEGDIDCGGSVLVKGKHSGRIDAGGSVMMG